MNFFAKLFASFSRTEVVADDACTRIGVALQGMASDFEEARRVNRVRLGLDDPALLALPAPEQPEEEDKKPASRNGNNGRKVTAKA